jgi:hypothetical protein
MVDNLDQSHGDARSRKIKRRIEDDSRGPRSIDRLPRKQWPHDIGRQHFDEDVRHQRSGNGNALHRPLEVAERPAERMVHESRGLGRGRHRHHVHQRAAVLIRTLCVRDAARNGARNRNDERGVCTKDEKRRKFDHERRRHRRPILRGGRLRDQAGDKDADHN